MTIKTRLSRLEKARPSRDQEDLSTLRASILMKLEEACNSENIEPVDSEDLSPEAKELSDRLIRRSTNSKP